MVYIKNPTFYATPSL